MRGPAPRWAAALIIALVGALTCVPRVMAGYITVSMGLAEQCSQANVTWSGDDGPYHLLLTPTTISLHGYNIWISSIPNGTMWYTLDIDLPSGLQYMVTVWGVSGITKAGTTDVLTVGASPTNDSTCFLTDEEILSLYTFSFNITNSNDGFPPQCSNLSMSWPTSLESNVASTTTKRDLLSPGLLSSDLTLPESVMDLEFSSEPAVDEPVVAQAPAVLSPFPPGIRRYPGRHKRAGPDLVSFAEAAAGLATDDTSSSNKTSGNTTIPPTMFGIIPLGNSFSIPITYSPSVAFANDLNDTSLSDTPTTYTKQGVTHLNWTIDLAKGTRFMLVAGIGSEEEWASGGSSEMMTVGQGSTGCVGSEQTGGGAPSITAGSSTSTSAVGTEPTTTTGTDTSPPPTAKSNWNGVIVACVFSAVATLLIVGAFWLCCRVRRRRRLAAQQGQPRPGLRESIVGKKGSGFDVRGGNGNGSGSDQDTQLDLIGSTSPSAVSSGIGASDEATPSRPGRPMLLPLMHDSSASTPDRTNGSSPTSPIGVMYEHPLGPNPMRPRPFMPGGSTMTSSTDMSGYTSPISPIHDRSELMARQTSMDPLLPYSHSSTQTLMSQYPGNSTDGSSHMSSMLYHRSLGRGGLLVLHDASQLDSPLSAGSGRFAGHGGDVDTEELDGEGEDIAELKRDTLAILGTAGPGPSSRSLTSGGIGGVLGAAVAGSGGASGAGGVGQAGAGTGSGGVGVGAPGAAGSARRRRTAQDEETSYLVHRDAGRVVAGHNRGAGVRVLELPPRYEELDWEAEGDGPREQRPRTRADGTASGTLASPNPSQSASSPISPSPSPNPITQSQGQGSEVEETAGVGAGAESLRLDPGVHGDGTRSGPTSPIEPQGLGVDVPRDTHTA